MIPVSFVEKWRRCAPWQSLDMIEQDLVISRVLVNLYSDPLISDKLILRGGTALNKLFIQPAARYSEDIDLVQKVPEPIGPTIDTIRRLLEPWLGEAKRKLTEQGAKLIYQYSSLDKLASKVKIEINTREHLQILPTKEVPFSVHSEWFQGESTVVTYVLEELLATKLRALYQRRKGRDLFDLWYTCKYRSIDMARVIDVFQAYCAHEGIEITQKKFKDNLASKRRNRDFQIDMYVLLPDKIGWDFEVAYDFVQHYFISQLP